MTPIPRLRPSKVALLSYGFRPFFLLGAIYAALTVLVWLPMFYGEVSVASAFAPLDWHVHEMIYGFVAAIVTGFLLTAIPNWTGRLPLQGAPLLFLVTVWLAGRIAVASSAYIGWLSAAAIDISFLIVVAAAAAREIAAGKNWRNMKVLIVLCVLIAGNVTFHWEAHARGSADYGIRIGLAAIITFIMLIGGRIVPSFTRNWLVRDNPGRLPIPFGRYDIASLVLSVMALVVWILAPFATITESALYAACVLQAIRVARWAGDRTLANPLVLVLHVGYAFVPLGFLLSGLGASGLVLPSVGIHAWAVGAAGTMVLAVMTRASLGHTGQELRASKGTQAIYLLVVLAAVCRIGAALAPSASTWLLWVAGIAWSAAYLGFAISYGPLLLAHRVGSANAPA
jgi:uncharacterized protein involved in response to NO